MRAAKATGAPQADQSSAKRTPAPPSRGDGFTGVVEAVARGDAPVAMTRGDDDGGVQAFKNVRIYEGEIPADLLTLPRRRGKDLFAPRPALG